MGYLLRRFGQLIELDMLDHDSRINEGTVLRIYCWHCLHAFIGQAAINAEIRRIDAAHVSEFNKLKKRQSRLNEALLRVTHENTKFMTEIAAASARQFQLERELNFSKKSSHTGSNEDSLPLLRRDLEERNRLVALVKLQAREIDALKVEIGLLRHKGGHVYIPSLPTTKPDKLETPPSMLGEHPLIPKRACEATFRVGVTPGLGHA